MRVYSAHDQSHNKWIFLLICLILLTGCTIKPSNPDGTVILPTAEEAKPYFGLDFPYIHRYAFCPELYSKRSCMPLQSLRPMAGKSIGVLWMNPWVYVL